MCKYWIAALSLTIATTHPAAAQDAGRFGITFQVPAALGFIWHATDKVALRPEFNIGTASAGSADNLMWGVAISAPYYLTNRDNVRTYLSPRVGYTRWTYDYVAGSASASTSQSQLNYSGSFGAQYAPIKRFNIFGETGYGYARNTSSAGSSSIVTSSTWSLRSNVGVILYFDP